MSNTARLSKDQCKKVRTKDKGEMGLGKWGEQERGNGGSNGRELRMERKKGEGRREEKREKRRKDAWRDLTERFSNSFT